MDKQIAYIDNLESQARCGIEQNGQPPNPPACRERAEVLRPDLIRCWWSHHSSETAPIARILPDNCAGFDQILPQSVARRLAVAIWAGDEHVVLQIFADAQPPRTLLVERALG